MRSRLRARGISWKVSAFLAVVAGLGLAPLLPGLGKEGRASGHAPEMYFQAYESQKAVYHVTYGGGWFGREHAHLMAVLNNHMNAVGEGFLDAHIVLQGDGLDLLIAAKKDPKIASAIDRLKKEGAHFSICYNTLVQRHLDPYADLYDVKKEDIVAAGVAEVTMLVNKGYAYLRI